MKKINWAIIGTGKIAHTFANALSKCENVNLTAVASRTLSKAEAFAEKYGFKKAYGSYKELAEDEAVEAVYIATPMSSHFGDTMLCLENSKNVLCEKSIALNCNELDKMLHLADEKNVFLMEAMWMKCRPTFLKAMEWINSGKIGTPQYIKADFCNFVPYNSEDRLFMPECGGGALLDLGVYPLTLADAVFGGNPDEIISFAHMSRGIDFSESITLRYGNAFVAINSGFEVSNRNNAVISGDKGSITLGDWFHCSSEAVLYDENGQEVEKSVIPDEINGYEYEIREFNRCLENGIMDSPLVPHSSTVAVMKMMDKCRKDWGMKYPNE